MVNYLYAASKRNFNYFTKTQNFSYFGNHLFSNNYFIYFSENIYTISLLSDFLIYCNCHIYNIAVNHEMNELQIEAFALL